MDDKIYSYEEALAASLEYFNGNELAATTYISKYALRDKQGGLREYVPTQTHRRLAKEFARIEAKYPNPLSEDEIFGYFDKFSKILPQGSPMAGIGNPYQVASLGNCFAFPYPYDSYSGILATDQHFIQASKRRAGAGVNISTLRPKGLPVANAAKTTDGIEVFVERFSNSLREVSQCIAEGEKVLTNSGLKPIEDVKPNVDKVWTKIGWVLVKDLLHNGKKTIWEVETKRGFKTRTTPEHLFVDGYLCEKPLNMFKVGDEVCLLPGTTTPKDQISLVSIICENTNGQLRNDVILPTSLSKDLAYFIGYSYGDSCVNYNKFNEPIGIELACANSYPGVKTKLLDIISENFGIKCNLSKGDGALERIRLNSKLVAMFLQTNGLLKQKSGSLEFPQKIWCSNSEIQMAFIAGYFDADGHVGGHKSGYCFSSIAKPFLSAIQTTLMSFGVVSGLSSEDRAKFGWNDLHRLSIFGRSSQELFTKTVGEYSEKVKQKNFIAKTDSTQTPYKANTFGIKYNKFPYMTGQNCLSVATYERYMSENVHPGLPKSLVKDTIVSIQQFEEQCDTYDLELETEHLFWCEGFYVHNSGRRGAGLVLLSVHHPEIEAFIQLKKDLKKATGLNLSVQITDEFMRAVKNDTMYEQRFPVDSATPVISTQVRARKIWDLIVEAAWRAGEPGLLFWDTIQRMSPADIYKDEGFETISCNACSELTMGKWGSCTLMSMNLFGFMKNPFSSDAYYDWEDFAKKVQIAQKLLDDLIELEIECIDRIIGKINTDPEPELIKAIELDMWENIKGVIIKSRRTGLGITALADTLAALGIKYGSKESIKFTNRIYKTLAVNSYISSILLAKERGAFPICDVKKEVGHIFIDRILKELPEDIKRSYLEYGRRNIANLTTAPVGTLSLLAQLTPGYYGTSSGIEPAFLLSYKRRRKINPSEQNAKVDFIDPLGDKWTEFEIYHTGYKLWQDINQHSSVDLIPENSPYYMSTANDLDWMASIELVGAAIEYNDHNISKTTNLPKNASKELVADVYMAAWEHGLKGVTVYRDGSRTGVLVDTAPTPEANTFVQHAAPHRPKELSCDIHHVSVQGEKWNIFVGLMDGKPYEVIGGLAKYVSIPKRVKTGKILKYNGSQNPKARYDLHYDYEKSTEDETIIRDIGNVFENGIHGAFSRTLSLALRHGVPVQYIVEQLLKGSEETDLFSFAKVVSRVLKKYIVDGTKPTGVKQCENPECHDSRLVYKEGCISCISCGWSKCS